jgi:translation elongation factor EF-4
MPHDVCISYSSKDRERILVMAEQLRGAGVSVWIDQGGIDAASLWTAEIVKAIDGCKVLLLALSAASAESANVVKEVSLALDRKKHILPVNLEPVEVPVAARAQRKPLNDKVIAVLPFVNISRTRRATTSATASPRT